MFKNYKFHVATYYSITVLYIVFFMGKRFDTDYKSIVNCIPFQKVFVFFEYQNYNDLGKLAKFFAELFGNIILFVPFSFAIKQLFRMYYSLKKTVQIALIVSVSIECLQYLFNIGVVDIDDVILNVVGSYIGYLLFINPFKTRF